MGQFLISNSHKLLIANARNKLVTITNWFILLNDYGLIEFYYLLTYSLT